jgi:hypothetical protein
MELPGGQQPGFSGLLISFYIQILLSKRILLKVPDSIG